MDRNVREISSSNSPLARISVVVRKRPLHRKEILRNELDVLKCIDTRNLVVEEPRVKVNLTKYIENHEFSFDGIFNEKHSNEAVYKACIKPLVFAAFESGARCSCFTYGQTGSGKTFTMLGAQPYGKSGTAGVLELAADDIFSLLSTPAYMTEAALYVSFFEIYGGKVFDLLQKRKILSALESSKREVVVKDLRTDKVTSKQDLLQKMIIGVELRKSGANSINDESSRSHAILQTDIRINGVSRGKLVFIDLAGSERGADTFSLSRDTQKDGAGINRSLLALKECIRAMDSESKHVPFRDSELTKVLRDMFYGNSYCLMIANVSPCASCCEQSINTLRYAARVKNCRASDVPPLDIECVTETFNSDGYVTPELTENSRSDGVGSPSLKECDNINGYTIINAAKDIASSSSKIGTKSQLPTYAIVKTDSSNAKNKAVPKRTLRAVASTKQIRPVSGQLVNSCKGANISNVATPRKLSAGGVTPNRNSEVRPQKNSFTKENSTSMLPKPSLGIRSIRMQHQASAEIQPLHKLQSPNEKSKSSPHNDIILSSEEKSTPQADNIKTADAMSANIKVAEKKEIPDNAADEFDCDDTDETVFVQPDKSNTNLTHTHTHRLLEMPTNIYRRKGGEAFDIDIGKKKSLVASTEGSMLRKEISVAKATVKSPANLSKSLMPASKPRKGSTSLNQKAVVATKTVVKPVETTAQSQAATRTSNATEKNSTTSELKSRKLIDIIEKSDAVLHPKVRVSTEYLKNVIAKPQITKEEAESLLLLLLSIPNISQLHTDNAEALNSVTKERISKTWKSLCHSYVESMNSIQKVVNESGHKEWVPEGDLPTAESIAKLRGLMCKILPGVFSVVQKLMDVQFLQSMSNLNIPETSLKGVTKEGVIQTSSKSNTSAPDKITTAQRNLPSERQIKGADSQRKYFVNTMPANSVNSQKNPISQSSELKSTTMDASKSHDTRDSASPPVTTQSKYRPPETSRGTDMNTISPNVRCKSTYRLVPPYGNSKQPQVMPLPTAAEGSRQIVPSAHAVMGEVTYPNTPGARRTDVRQNSRNFLVPSTRVVAYAPNSNAGTSKLGVTPSQYTSMVRLPKISNPVSNVFSNNRMA